MKHQPVKQGQCVDSFSSPDNQVVAREFERATSPGECVRAILFIPDACHFFRRFSFSRMSLLERSMAATVDRCMHVETMRSTETLTPTKHNGSLVLSELSYPGCGSSAKSIPERVSRKGQI